MWWNNMNVYKSRYKPICYAGDGIVYREAPADFMQPHDTWIIAFCPDTDSFFATNQRAFFWETEEEFNTEQDAIYYFERHIKYFVDIENDFMCRIVYNWNSNKVYLENTDKWYSE